MLAKWTKILPFFVVEWLASKKCEKITYGSYMFGYTAYKDCMVKISKK